MTAPSVLGLDTDEAAARLDAAGFAGAEILISGRRREGRPRVIRQKMIDGRIELVVSYFKELASSQKSGVGSHEMGCTPE